MASARSPAGPSPRPAGAPPLTRPASERPPPRPASERPLIGPLLEQAARLVRRVEGELPGQAPLVDTARQVLDAAEKAERVTRAMRRPWSPHRLPVVFLASALIGLIALLYWQYFHVARLSVALPDRDAAMLREKVRAEPRLDVSLVEVPGSREAVAALEQGTVDVGYVQGGVPIPERLPRMEVPARELVLYLRRTIAPTPPAVVLTSVEGEGSVSVARTFFAAWGQPVRFVHAWPALTRDPAYAIPSDVDAVFVVKDPADERTLIGVERLLREGFRLVPATLGVRASRLSYLQPTTLPAGYFGADPPEPATALPTYSVATYLVARLGLTPRLMNQAARLVNTGPASLSERGAGLSSGEASELLQGTEAGFSILLNIGLGFLALLGLDMVAYRRRFHELNSLVSAIGILQSNKDILGAPREVRAENLLYLSLCSDLLSLISAIGGYYTHENSSLLFSNLSEVIHQRCDALKINIQLKLLHAVVGEGQ